MSNENLTSESFWHDGYETSFNLIKTVKWIKSWKDEGREGG